MREVAKHERRVRVARGDSWVQLWLRECLANLPSASITPWLHSCKVYHFFYNIIKRENVSICLQLSPRYEFMCVVICPRVNKSCFSKTSLWVLLSLEQPVVPVFWCSFLCLNSVYYSTDQRNFTYAQDRAVVNMWKGARNACTPRVFLMSVVLNKLMSIFTPSIMLLVVWKKR